MKQLLRSLFLVMVVLIVSGCDNEEPMKVTRNTRSDNSTVITIEEARADLLGLMADLNEEGPLTRSSSMSRIENEYSIPVRTLTRVENEELPKIHVFNFKDNKGYAIMSGDKRIPSLLAYAKLGNLSQDSVIDNPGFELFIRGLDLYIKDNTLSDFVGDVDPQYDYVVFGEWENIVYKENGFCKVKWGQGKPYNMFCFDGKGDEAATGCVATAMAQFMSVYRYPASYDGITFDWEAMTAHPDAKYCANGAQIQIAQLMKRLGDKGNLNVTYGRTASGADRNNIPRTLEAFGFTNGGRVVDYSTTSVVAELEKGNPVIIAGNSKKKEVRVLGIKFGTIYSGGHAWLLHGLLHRKRNVYTYNMSGNLKHTRTENAWYPLCNWGWYGLRDGYYLSGVFDVKEGPEYSDDGSIAEDRRSEIFENYQYRVQIISGVVK